MPFWYPISYGWEGEVKCLKVRAVVVAQLVERSLPIPEVRSLNPVIGKNLFVYCQLCIEKMKIKKKRPGMAHFFKKNLPYKALDTVYQLRL